MSRPTAWLLGAAALALAAGTAFATEQTARAQAAEDAAKAPSKTERGRHFRGGGHEQLKDILQLRPDQEPALQAYIEATRGEGGHRNHMVKFDRDEDRSTPQRLDEMEAKLAEQQAQAKARIGAIRAFYAQLDERQRKAFDAMPMLMMVGPSMGPMMLPHPVHIAHRMPEPPAPPRPPKPPRP